MPILAPGNTVASPGHVLIGNLTQDYFYQYSMRSFRAAVNLTLSFSRDIIDTRNTTHKKKMIKQQFHVSLPWIINKIESWRIQKCILQHGLFLHSFRQLKMYHTADTLGNPSYAIHWRQLPHAQRSRRGFLLCMEQQPRELVLWDLPFSSSSKTDFVNNPKVKVNFLQSRVSWLACTFKQ